MSERNINMNEILSVAKEASTINDQTLKEISLANIDRLVLNNRGLDQKKKATVEHEKGNITVAENFDQVAERAFTANSEVIDKLKANSEILVKNLSEVPILLVKPKEMLRHLKNGSAHMLGDTEIARLEALGFSKDDIKFMVESELQTREYLNTRLETIKILMEQEDVNVQLKAQNPNSGMSLDDWDKRAQLEAARDLYVARLNAPKYKDEVDVLRNQYEIKKRPDQNFLEFVAEQEMKTLEKKVDFSHADRLREAYEMASLAKYI